MPDAYLTIIGNLVDAPTLRRTKTGGFPVASFRVAQTSRRYDQAQGGWTDRDTLFVSCTAWRALGENVHQSLTKGQPVVVHGRFTQREYKVGESMRTAYELEAVAVGPDLSRGVATFERVTRSAPAMTLVVDEQGIPVDHSSEYLDVDDAPDNEELPDGVDPVTGEVRELVPSA